MTENNYGLIRRTWNKSLNLSETQFLHYTISSLWLSGGNVCASALCSTCSSIQCHQWQWVITLAYGAWHTVGVGKCLWKNELINTPELAGKSVSRCGFTNQERQQQETLLSTWKVLSGSSRSMPSIPNISVCTVKESGLIGPLCPDSIGVSLMMKMKALVLGLRNEIYSFSQPLSILFTPKGVLQAFLHLHLLTPLCHFIKHTITYLSSRFRAQRVFWCFLPSTYS